MRFGVQVLARAEIWIKISALPAPVANSAMMSTLTAHFQWEDETVRERTGHPHSYAEAKKMKSLTLHSSGCPGASLRDCSSSCSNVSAVILFLLGSEQHCFLLVLHLIAPDPFVTQ